MKKIFLAFVNQGGNAVPAVENLFNLFGGVSYKPNSIFYLSVVGGPSFVSDPTLGLRLF
jgi:hypothetical protein